VFIKFCVLRSAGDIWDMRSLHENSRNVYTLCPGYCNNDRQLKMVIGLWPPKPDILVCGSATDRLEMPKHICIFEHGELDESVFKQRR